MAFVYDVLFPYARARLEAFLQTHAGGPEVQAALARLRQEHESDVERGLRPPPWPDPRALPPALAYLRWLMDADRKSTALKELQGRIWQEGFARGELRGQTYPDVPPALARWQRQGRRTYIYSSGSVLAQRLIFSTTPAGDLTRYLGGYFDTTVGAKKEAESYRRIAAQVRLEPGAVLFVSDSAEEVGAARAAGLQAVLCARPGESGPHQRPPDAITTFDVLAPDPGPSGLSA